MIFENKNSNRDYYDCKSSIVKAIEDNYRNNRLDSISAVAQVLNDYDKDIVEYILAVSIKDKSHNRRISRDNKAWANEILTDSQDSEFFVIDEYNPGLLDLFVNQFRKEQESCIWRTIWDDDEADYDKLDVIRETMDIQLSNSIIIFADVERWNGRTNGYKLIKSGNIRDIFCQQIKGFSRLHFYCNGLKDICCSESHHDGFNHYIFRELKEPDYIVDDICWFKKDGFSKTEISKYTKSLYPYFEEAGLL